MNAAPPAHDFVLQPPRRNWGTAWRAVRRLLADKDDTVQVFEIMRALNGTATRDGYLRLLRTTQGGRLAYERRELAAVLMDREALAKLPPGSLAAHYLAFTERGQITADGLAGVSRQMTRGDTTIDLVHPYAWYGRRIRDSHDLWHVLTGYDLSALGEAALVAFSYAQTRALGWALIGTGAALRGARQPGQPYARAILEGYARGRRAAWLPRQDYEALLAEPLEAVRAKLLLTPPKVFDSIPFETRDQALPKR